MNIIDFLFVATMPITLAQLLFAMIGCFVIGAVTFWFGGKLHGQAEDIPYFQKRYEELRRDRNKYRAIVLEHGESWKL